MNKTKKRWLLAALILVVAGGVVFAGSSAFEYGALSTARCETVTHEIRDRFDRIDVFTAVGDVILAPAEDGVCRVVCREVPEKPHSVSVENGTLTVETTTGDLNLRGVAVEGALSAHTTTGDIRLERVDAASLAIAATTGDVTGTLCSEKRFAVHTGTGDVSVPATASGGVCEIETSTGDVHIELA